MAVHLKRKYADELYYYKSKQTGIDIDFYLPDEGTAIQVAYRLEGSEEREVGRLLSFAQKKGDVGRLIIVTDEEENIIKRDGFEIEVVPVHRFLLG